MKDLKKSLFISLWFMLLTFPIMVIRVNTIEKVIEWRWHNLALVGIGSFLFSFVWRLLLNRRERGRKLSEKGNADSPAIGGRLLEDSRIYRPALAALALLAIGFPFLFSSYRRLLSRETRRKKTYGIRFFLRIAVGSNALDRRSA